MHQGQPSNFLFLCLRKPWGSYCGSGNKHYGQDNPKDLNVSPVTSPARLLSFSLSLLARFFTSKHSHRVSSYQCAPLYILNVKLIRFTGGGCSCTKIRRKKMSLSIDRGSWNINVCYQQIWWTWLLFLISLSHVVRVSQTGIARPVDLRWGSSNGMILTASLKSVSLI